MFLQTLSRGPKVRLLFVKTIGPKVGSAFPVDLKSKSPIHSWHAKVLKYP